METIEQIHQALGYSEADASALKKVRALWRKLEGFRIKATKGGAQDLRSYRELLEKSLVSARLVQELPDITQAALGFWEWYVSEVERLGIPAKEISRGRDHQAWCEKWLHREYTQFVTGYQRFTDTPSQASLDEAKEAAGKMLQAYVEAFQKN